MNLNFLIRPAVYISAILFSSWIILKINNKEKEGSSRYKNKIQEIKTILKENKQKSDEKLKQIEKIIQYCQ